MRSDARKRLTQTGSGAAGCDLSPGGAPDDVPASPASAPESAIEAVAEAIYPDVMSTWEDEWPIWEYADEGQAEFCRDLARTAIEALDALDSEPTS